MPSTKAPRGASAARRTKVPSVIRCAYARAVTLEQAAREVCAAANLPPPDLRRAGDPPEYADALLRRTFVSFPGRAPALPPDASLAQHCDADETIARALSHLFRARSHPNNVLCYGARRLGPNPPASARVSLGGAVASRGANIPPGDRDRAPPAAATESSARAFAPPRDVEVMRRSAALEALRRPPWRVFAARAGDDVFFHLLTNASVFAPADAVVGAGGGGGGCHVQLCGAPVSGVAKIRAARAAVAAAREPARGGLTDEPRRAKRGDGANGRGGSAMDASMGGDVGGSSGDGRRGNRRGTGARNRGTEKKKKGPDPRTPHPPRKNARETASSEDPRGQTASGPDEDDVALERSTPASVIRRVSRFVRGVVTANPFIALAAAAARDRGGGESSTDVVEESPADGSERPGEDRSREAMRSGSCAAGAKPRKPRPSSWRRRRDAARRMSAAAREDASSPETSAVPETPEACMWNRIGDAAAESSGHDDGYEARNEARERGERARATFRPRAAAAETSAGGGGRAAPPPSSNAADAAPRSRTMSPPAVGAKHPPGRRRAPGPSKPGVSAKPGREGVRARAPGSTATGAPPASTSSEARPRDVVFEASAFMHKSSYTRLPGLPRRHLLNAAGVGPGGARRVYARIFGRRDPPGSGRRGSSVASDARPGSTGSSLGGGLRTLRDPANPPGSNPPRRRKVRRVPRVDREALLPLLSLTLRRAARCPYGRILDAKCPMPPGLARRGGSLGGRESRESRETPAGEAAPASEPKSLLASFTPPAKVAAFLWAVITRVAPREMLGGAKSRAALRAFLLRLVVLRRFEQCTLHEAMRGIRTREFPWLFGERGAWDDDDKTGGRREGRRGGPAKAAVARRAKLQRWIKWLIEGLAVPLLRAHFYCTETETHRLRVFYYRKGVWARVVAAHLAAMTEDPDGETRDVRTPSSAPLEPEGPEGGGLGGADERTRERDRRRSGSRSNAAREEPAREEPARTAAYRRMSKRRARTVLQRHLLGFARLRLLPKAAGLRPVAMLGRPATASFRSLRGGKFKGGEGGGGRAGRDTLAFRPVNSSLQGVFDVLRREAHARPGAMGANVSDYREAHRRLGPFIRSWRAEQRRLFAATRGSRGGANNAVDGRGAPNRHVAGPARVVNPPFIVAADVKGAFDSIPLASLERVATELVGSAEYEVSRMTHTTGGMSGGVRTKTRRVAAPVVDEEGKEGIGGGEGNIRSASSLGAIGARRRGGVVIDLATPDRVHRAQVLELLREHLRRNVVRSGGVYLLQTTGIPQGSVLSSLLCAVFYARLEHSRGLGTPPGADDAGKPSSVLCRWIDDLLHVSSSRAPAEAFLSAALEGFAEYGCVVNPAKTSLNFDYDAPGRATRGSAAPLRIPRRELVVGSGPLATRGVPWCGLLIDSATLEITVDYARYAGDWAREAVTVPGRAGHGRSSPFATLGRRVVAYLRPKCAGILYDQSINSPRTARLNVYQNFLLAAVKLHCFIAAASGDGRGGRPSPKLVHAAIAQGVRFMEDAVRRHSAVARATLGAQGRIQRGHVRFLGYRAFFEILKRKQARHAGTLKRLERELRAPGMRAVARTLEAVVDERLSSVFREIRF